VIPKTDHWAETKKREPRAKAQRKRRRGSRKGAKKEKNAKKKKKEGLKEEKTFRKMPFFFALRSVFGMSPGRRGLRGFRISWAYRATRFW
jgi:hypothetical protein